MAAFSMDLRTRIFESWQRGDDTQEGLARLYGVSLSWLVKFLSRWRRTGSLAPLPHGGGPTPCLDDDEEDLVATRIAQKPDITLGELQADLERRTGTVASGPTLCRVCQRLGLPRKKKVLRATERQRPDIQRERHAWRRHQAELEPPHTVIVDETGANRAMTRGYGRAPPGQRVWDAVPLAHWQMTTLLLSLRPDGAYTAMTIPEAVTGEVFRAYVEQVLAPSLHDGDVVIMDNLQPHKVAGVREAITRAGARLEFLPAYSPDCCPLDPCFAKIKNMLRTLKARTHHAVSRALAKGLAMLTRQDVRNCFAHCGYRV